MAKRWALWGLFAVLSVAALISGLGTAFQTLPLNHDMAEMAFMMCQLDAMQMHSQSPFPYVYHYNGKTHHTKATEI